MRSWGTWRSEDIFLSMNAFDKNTRPKLPMRTAQSGAAHGTMTLSSARLITQNHKASTAIPAKDTRDATAKAAKLNRVEGGWPWYLRSKNAYCRRYSRVKKSCFISRSSALPSNIQEVVCQRFATSMQGIRERELSNAVATEVFCAWQPDKAAIQSLRWQSAETSESLCSSLCTYSRCTITPQPRPRTDGGA